MAVNSVYRVEVFQNVGSELTMNVLHVRETVSETINVPIGDAVSQMAYNFYLALAEFMSEDWRVVQILVRDVAGGIPSTTVFGGAEAIVGAVESEIIPSTSAMLISLYSNNPERTGRGRIYLPGLPESAQNEGQMVEGVWASFQSVCHTQLRGEKGPFLAGDGKFRWTIWAPNSAAPSEAQDVREVQVRPNLATIRSRRAHPGFAQ